jgi:transcriptional regulator with XRE-family HTH domain
MKEKKRLNLEDYLKGIEKGYSQIPLKDVGNVRKELCAVIGIKKTSLVKYLDGRSNPRIKQVIAIRDYFYNKYGLKPEQVFGKSEEEAI